MGFRVVVKFIDSFMDDFTYRRDVEVCMQSVICYIPGCIWTANCGDANIRDYTPNIKLIINLHVNYCRDENKGNSNKGDIHHSTSVYWIQRDALLFSTKMKARQSTQLIDNGMEQVKKTFYSVYEELRASACFEHYFLIIRSCCTNGSWYIMCVLCHLAVLAVPGLDWKWCLVPLQPCCSQLTTRTQYTKCRLCSAS
jgi:hypothetical protein